MEYGTLIGNNQHCNDNYTQHVLYTEHDNYCIKKLFGAQTRRTISSKITELLAGVDPQNRPIIVPDKTICSVLDSVYNNFRPATGDIYARYNIPSGVNPENYLQSIVDQTIEIIVSDVKNNMLMEQNNSNMSVWTTVLGDFNEHGLQQHPKIKVRNKRPTPMQFHMRY